MKKILFKIGYFLFELGVAIVISLVFSDEGRKSLEQLIKDLDGDSELSARQKYNRAKKFLDEIADDVPEVAKNIAIEAIVAKVTNKGQKLLQNIK